MTWQESSDMLFCGDTQYACVCGCNSFRRHRELPLYLCRRCGMTSYSRSEDGRRVVSVVGALKNGGCA